jgi:hypothetical protein
MTTVVALQGGRTASCHIIGSGRPTLMFAGGPGFTAAYMDGDAELLSDTLRSYLIDPHGSGLPRHRPILVNTPPRGTPASTRKYAGSLSCGSRWCSATRSGRQQP